MEEQKRREKFRFDGKKLIPEILFINAIIYQVFNIQYIIIPLRIGGVFYEYWFFIFVFCLLTFLNLVGAKYYTLMPVALGLNSILLLVGMAIFGYMVFFLNGPFDQVVLTVGLVLLILNGFGYVVNIRGHWKDSFGSFLIGSLILIVVIVYLLLVYGHFADILVSIVVFCVFLLIVTTQIKVLITHKFNIFKMLNFEFFKPSEFRRNTLKKVGILAIILGSVGILGYGSISGFGMTITIKAPEGFKTVSSYWGPPALTLKEVNTTITITDLDRLVISNDTLENDPDFYRNGTLAYLIGLYEEGNPINYANYSAGAESYPNGTVILSEPLNLGHGVVNVTFKYVYNNKVLEYLNISRSTLVMNYHGDFIYHDNIFDRIETTYLLQLLDFWEIKFFLDIYNGYDFPHVFNYLDSIPLGYTTLYWAHGKFDMFQGISYDFEPGGHPVSPGNPGGTAFTIGELIGQDGVWEEARESWYSSNEQNRTLFKEATQAYEELYAEASSLGYRTYITLGGGELMDAWDGDIDYTRCPVDPFSSNPDVLYGMMCYQDNNFKTGRFSVYRDCVNQIAQLGNQGKTILLGWLAVGTRYYTDDEVGLQRYIDDCKIAQATGMVEIFHAPIYRMQNKWGDEAILRLHEALNEEPLEAITIEFPLLQYNTNTLFDVVENLNYLWQAIPILVFIVVKIMLSNAFPLKSKIKARK